MWACTLIEFPVHEAINIIVVLNLDSIKFKYLYNPTALNSST